LGGALAYETTDVTVNTGRGGAPGNSSEFLFNPRVGYAHMFGRVVGIWPRAGLTYHSETANNVENINGFALGIEAQFVFVPAQHFAILLGPSLDLDFTGRTKPNQGSEVDHGYRSIRLAGRPDGLDLAARAPRARQSTRSNGTTSADASRSIAPRTVSPITLSVPTTVTSSHHPRGAFAPIGWLLRA